VRIHNFCLLIGVLGLGCIPPLPLQFYNHDKPNAAADLSKEEFRLLSLSEHVAFTRITEALLHMNCRITASDRTGNILSFEQSKEFQSPGSIGFSIKEGTLHLTQSGAMMRAQLVLMGKVLRGPRGGSQKLEFYGRLSSDEHKMFFNELTSALDALP